MRFNHALSGSVAGDKDAASVADEARAQVAMVSLTGSLDSSNGEFLVRIPASRNERGDCMEIRTAFI